MNRILTNNYRGRPDPGEDRGSPTVKIRGRRVMRRRRSSRRSRGTQPAEATKGEAARVYVLRRDEREYLNKNTV